MGEFRSIETSTTFLWSETYANSAVYEQQHFVPSVFEFDIDRDSLRPRNITLVSVGTRIPYIASRDSSTYRRYFVGLNYDSPIRFYWFNHTGLGIYLYYSPKFTTLGWLDSYRYGCWDGSSTNGSKGALLGTYYHPDTNSYYLFVATKFSNSDGWNISGYWLDQDGLIWSDDEKILAKKWIADNFYGAALPESYIIIRDEPSSSIFNGGQTSQLLYSLTTKSGILISTDISIVPLGIGSSPGWVFDGTVSPPTLTLTSSEYRFSVKASCEYDGITYELVDTFYPDDYTPYGPGGVSRPGGGGGSFDGGPTDDPTIFIPNGTTEDNASLSGIYTRYVLNSDELTTVGNRLWTKDIISTISNSIAKLFSSPFESIISLLSFPFDVSSMGGYSSVSRIMTWGNVQFISDGLFDVPNTAAVSFDWGEISIESFYDGFLDYAPYTKMELYLPWGTGVVSIDPNECTPGKIRIRSNVELDKGTAVHIVTSEFTRDGRTVKEILGTYGTVVGKQIPITALDYAGKAHAVASVAVTAGAIALAGGAGAAASSAGAATSGASTMALSTAVSPAQLAPIAATAMPPLMYNAPKSEEFKITPESVKLATEGINAAMTPGHVARNGSFMTGSAGLLPTTPFLIISRPEQSVPKNYGHYYGYPSNIYSKLSDLSGFTQVGSIHLENIVCTEKEREELMTLLQGGVLL